MHDLVALYVVDALDDLERRRFETHLESCDRCLAELRELSDGMDLYVSDSEWGAPAQLRDDVMAAVDAEVPGATPARPSIGRWAVALAVGVAAVAALVVAVGLSAGDPTDRVLAADDAVTYVVEATPFDDVRVVFSPGRGRVVFLAEGLPDPGQGMTYQLWLIGSDGPVSAGTFIPSEGTARVLLDGEAEAGLTVGLTVEPAGGSEAPTGDVLVAEELS